MTIASEPDRMPRPARALWVSVCLWLAAALLALLLGSACVFALVGGRYFIVETPSMGQTAPVGTVVFSLPATMAVLRVGDIITFHPPTAPSETYTHRIVAIRPAGITTRGDNNGSADGWVVTERDLVGKVSGIARGLGWLIKCVPLTLVGGVVVWFVTRYVRSPTNRSAFRVGGYAFAFALAIAIVRPFVRIVMLTATAGHGVAHATVVSTGMLPIRVTAKGGTFVDLLSGQIGSVSVKTLAKAHYQVLADLHLSPLGWVIFLGCCAIPLFYIIIVGLPRDETRGRPTIETEERDEISGAESRSGAGFRGTATPQSP